MTRALGTLAALALPLSALAGLNLRVDPKAVAFVLDAVQCSNPEQVAHIVFGDRVFVEGDEVDDDESAHEEDGDYLAQSSAVALDLGDGTISYVFEAPGGAGRWAVRPNYHFVMSGDRLRLLLDGRGASTDYGTDGAKYNGRYLVRRSGHTYVGDSGEQDVENLALFYEVYFWSGTEYLHAYTGYSLGYWEDLENPRPVEWVPEAKAAFLSAHVTWSHHVVQYDTLTGIGHQYGTDVDEIVAQNGIGDPDAIQEGQVLSYDSKRAAGGKHSHEALGTDAVDGAGY